MNLLDQHIIDSLSSLSEDGKELARETLGATKKKPKNKQKTADQELEDSILKTFFK